MLKGQPVINYCPQISILLDRLYHLVIDGQGNGGWAGLPEINHHFLSLGDMMVRKDNLHHWSFPSRSHPWATVYFRIVQVRLEVGISAPRIARVKRLDKRLNVFAASENILHNK